MTDRATSILGKTLAFGGIYFLVTLGIGFLCAAFAMSAGLSDSYHSGGAGGIEIVLWVLQPIAAFLGWLGTKHPSIHEHVSLVTLVLASCVWSFVIGYVYALLTRKTQKA